MSHLVISCLMCCGAEGFRTAPLPSARTRPIISTSASSSSLSMGFFDDLLKDVFSNDRQIT